MHYRGGFTIECVSSICRWGGDGGKMDGALGGRGVRGEGEAAPRLHPPPRYWPRGVMEHTHDSSPDVIFMT